MAEFEEACCALGIALFVLPPRSPKLNGHVERMQRTFKEEFYTRPLPTLLSELQAELIPTWTTTTAEGSHGPWGSCPLEFFWLRCKRSRFLKESQMC
jgi:putative transposase